MNRPVMPLVSIGIPTYNRADGYLIDALNSALAQTYPHVEIIVSDNCSNDGTQDLVGSFSDERIIYYRHHTNIGPANNFNFCLNQAKGDYFILLHDDDLIDPDFIETCMKHANYKTEYGIIRTGVRIIDEHGHKKSEKTNNVDGLDFDEFLLGWFNHLTSWYLCNTLFNTAKLKAIGGFQSKRNLLQDCVAIVKLSSKFQRVDVRAVKASFRKHSEEITFSVKVKEWVDDFSDLLDLISTLSSNKAQIGKEAKRFFALLSYNRAMAVGHPIHRMIAYLQVYRAFGLKHVPPPVKRVVDKIGRLIMITNN